MLDEDSMELPKPDSAAAGELMAMSENISVRSCSLDLLWSCSLKSPEPELLAVCFGVESSASSPGVMGGSGKSLRLEL